MMDSSRLNSHVVNYNFITHVVFFVKAFYFQLCFRLMCDQCMTVLVFKKMLAL